jgi:hypothetical protein
MMFGKNREFPQNFDSIEIDRCSKCIVALKLTAWLAIVLKRVLNDILELLCLV